MKAHRIACLIALFLLASCRQDTVEIQSFSLPDGDPAAGKQVFVELQCNSCHSLPEVPQLPQVGEGGVSIQLGGEVRVIKTYGQLVTAIINPSHKIYQGYADKHKGDTGESAMTNYNDIMTVTQLIDLVSYLQTQYHLQPFERSQYRAFHPDS